MSTKNFSYTEKNSDDVADYLMKTYSADDAILESVVKSTTDAGMPMIQVGPLDGLLLEVLVRAVGAIKCVEVGTLAGYSAIRIARALPTNGKLYTIEYDPKHAEIARKNIQTAGVASKVEVFTGAGVDVLPSLNDKGPFDLVFIDADKAGYTSYLKWAESNLKIGGIVLGDNALAFGFLTEKNIPEREVKSVEALRKFNQALGASRVFKSAMIPTGEGLAIGVKIAEPE